MQHTKHSTTLIIMSLRHPVYFTIGNYEFQFHSYDPVCGFVLEETTHHIQHTAYILRLSDLITSKFVNEEQKQPKRNNREKKDKKKRFLFCKCFFIYPFERTQPVRSMH